jgi:hypothetical protein
MQCPIALNNKDLNCVIYKTISTGVVVVMIVWLLDLQLPMQSVPITTNVVSSNPARGEL